MFTKVEQDLGQKIPDALRKLSGGKWEWKPEVGEWFIDEHYGNDLRLIKEPLYASYIEYCCGEGFKIIPLLHWENHLEPILEGMGYYLRVDSFPRDHIHVCRIMSSYTSKQICSAEAKKRQEAVQRAILALAEEKEK